MPSDAGAAPHLRLTPVGRLRTSEETGVEASAFARRVLEAFRSSEARGLFELAAAEAEAYLPPEFAYWRDFGARYLTERCHTPAGTGFLEALPSLAQDTALTIAAEAPPMEGAEYLSAEMLQRLWEALDRWVLAEAAEAGGLEVLLSKRAPLWRQVGRVCFHLAENRRDSEFPFAFLATYAPRLVESERVRYQPLSRALQESAGDNDRKALLRLLGPVSLAAKKSPLVQGLLDSGDLYHPLAWTPAEAYAFLREIPLFEESGVLVRLPDWWAKRPRPQVAVSIGGRAVSMLGADAVLDFDIGVALGDESLSAKEVEAILAGGVGLRLLRGRWVEVDPEQLGEALAHWKKVEKGVKAGGISFVEGMRLLAGASSSLVPVDDEALQDWSVVGAGPWLRELLAGLRSPESLEAGLPGKELHAELRHYQVAGLQWLRLLTGLGLGACLADDMGLGKTVQVLALLLLVKKEAKGRATAKKPQVPSLLVLPASLLANWKAEMERFAPSLRARFVHPSILDEGSLDEGKAGEGRAKKRSARGSDSSVPGDFDLVVTTYGMLLRQEWLQQVQWNLLILDEAQAIRNPGTAQTRAVKRLRACARIALTGTPVENRLSDLWSLFDFLCPGLLGSAAAFGKFTKGLEKRETERYAPLRSLVRPYILRRLKTDRSVIPDLPDKTEVAAFCGLTKTQAALYGSVADELAEGLRSATGMARRGLVLSTLMRLKQVCNHPSQFTGDGVWDPKKSGKFARLAEIADEIASRQDRVLVFTQFREMTGPLAVFLKGIFGRPGLVLHGGTPVKSRQELVKTFQAEDGPPFFVLSLKAGGTGLNLTAASHVLHFDRWWNPAVESQATDRAFRIGQEKNVLVHKFVCIGTVEERIDALLSGKKALAEDLLEGGAEATLTELSDEELLATVGLDLGRALAGA
jgi:non-specific serine/threonine protein kinase